METASSRRVDSYLGSNAIRAMSSTLSLASTVLRFQIVELWHENEDGEYCCTFVHAVEEVVKQYKEIIVGYYPKHTREHMISPRICKLSKSSNTRCHWQGVEETGSGESCLYKISGFPVLTEMGYVVEGRGDGPNVFIVGFASELVEKKQSKMKFLFGLGYALSVAAFDFEDEDLNEEEDKIGDELDIKKFVPARPLVATPLPSTVSMGTLLAGFPSVNASSSNMLQMASGIDAGLGIWGKNLSNVNFQCSHVPSVQMDMPSANDTDEIGLDICDSPGTGGIVDSSSNFIHSAVAVAAKGKQLGDSPSVIVHDNSVESIAPSIPHSKLLIPALDLANVNGVVPIATVMEKAPSPVHFLTSQSGNPFCVQENVSVDAGNSELPVSAHTNDSRSGPDMSRHSVASTILTSLLPTWDPAAPFSFPVASLPAQHVLPDDLTIESFTDVKHIADGSNANIFTAKIRDQRVIIKMIKTSVQLDTVSIHEFDVEHGLLCRISHPNIIKILGAGISPRRFIVLEYLEGGTLNTVLSEHIAKSGLASRLFRKPSFTYNNLLVKARDIADALDYVHSRVYPGACIIHRDLKPDNVGFSSDGVVKLFDFGLATCVKARESDSESYEMSGMTGSLRYMAPETALRKPYTEKVDVYSYGILIWQMARDKVPFKGLNKDEFLKNVSIGGERPKLDSSWPSGFSSLLTKCWHQDPSQRPSFCHIVEELNRLIHGDSATPGRNRIRRGPLLKNSNESASSSTWF